MNLESLKSLDNGQAFIAIIMIHVIIIRLSEYYKWAYVYACVSIVLGFEMLSMFNGILAAHAIDGAIHFCAFISVATFLSFNGNDLGVTFKGIKQSIKDFKIIWFLVFLRAVIKLITGIRYSKNEIMCLELWVLVIIGIILFIVFYGYLTAYFIRYTPDILPRKWKA